MILFSDFPPSKQPLEVVKICFRLLPWVLCPPVLVVIVAIMIDGYAKMYGSGNDWVWLAGETLLSMPIGAECLILNPFLPLILANATSDLYLIYDGCFRLWSSS